MIGLRLLRSIRRSHRVLAWPIRQWVLLVLLLFAVALLIQLPDIRLDILAKAIVSATATGKIADWRRVCVCASTCATTAHP